MKARMSYVIIRHKVQDFAKWKPIYDAHGAVRKQSGCKHEQLFRLANDPNELVILTEWDSVENAKKFAQSSDLKEKMRSAGVLGTPEFVFLEQLEKKASGFEKAA